MKSRERVLQSGQVVSGGRSTSSSSGMKSRSSFQEPIVGANLRGEAVQVYTGFVAVSNIKKASQAQQLDITSVYAKTDPLGARITPSTWQRDADPVFIWEPPASGLNLAGYSYALDADPDNTIDTVGTSWDVSQDAVKKLADGTHTFSVKAIDTAGQGGRPATFEIWVDTTPPTINASGPQPGSLLNTLSPKVSATVSDAHSGIEASGIAVVVNGSTAQAQFDPVTGTVTASGAGLFHEGSNRIELRVSDTAGNAQTPLVWSVTSDVTPPRGSLAINAGSVMTTSLYVTLNVSASDSVSSVTKMLISNDALTGYTEEPFTSVRELWRLLPVRGSRTVYVKFADAAGNVSEPVTDEIELQLLSPETIILSGPAGMTQERTPKFTFSCPDQNCVFSYAFDHDDWSDWTTEASATVAQEMAFGNHYFKVKAAKEVNGIPGIQPDEEDPTPAERTWIVGVETPVMPIPQGPPIKLWRLE